jgi:insulysin
MNAYQTPLHSTLTKLYVELVKDSLAEFSYMAECAGVHYAIEVHQEGILVAIGGYNDKVIKHFASE